MDVGQPFVHHDLSGPFRGMCHIYSTMVNSTPESLSHHPYLQAQLGKHIPHTGQKSGLLMVFPLHMLHLLVVQVILGLCARSHNYPVYLQLQDLIIL